MGGKALLLRLIEGMSAEASLALQVEDESPELGGSDLGHVGREAFGAQEAFQVADATRDDGDSPVALALGPGAEAVGGDKWAQICGQQRLAIKAILSY